MSSYFYHPVRASKPVRTKALAAHSDQPASEHSSRVPHTSTAQFLQVLLHTRLGQLRCATDFDCALWDVAFDNSLDVLRWKATLTRALLAAVQTHEPRLCNVRVRIRISPLAQSWGKGGQPVTRRQADINVQGTMLFTHEPISYTTQLRMDSLRPNRLLL